MKSPQYWTIFCEAIQVCQVIDSALEQEPYNLFAKDVVELQNFALRTGHRTAFKQIRPHCCLYESELANEEVKMARNNATQVFMLFSRPDTNSLAYTLL